jgi:hypothetical protein
MKKTLLFFVLALLVSAGSAFAMDCNTSMTPGQPDQCYTLVTVSSSETTLVSQGTVLVMDTNASSPLQGVQRVKVSSASTDTVVGVAQNTIASGFSSRVLVRGSGKIKINGGVVAGSILYSAASGGSGSVASTGARAIATALGTDAPTQTAQAFITVV